MPFGLSMGSVGHLVKQRDWIRFSACASNEGGMEGGRMRGEEEGIDREHERYEFSVLEWTSFYMRSKFLRQKLICTPNLTW